MRAAPAGAARLSPAADILPRPGTARLRSSATTTADIPQPGACCVSCGDDAFRRSVWQLLDVKEEG